MKKVFSYIKQWFSYSGNILSLIKTIGRLEKSYLAGYIFNILVTTMVPFSSIIFIKLLLTEFENERRFVVALSIVVLMCFVSFLLRFFMACLDRQEQAAIERIKARFLMGVEEVTMTMSYDKLENTKFIDKRQKAMEIFYPTMSGFMDLHKTIYLSRTLFANILQIIGFITILFTLKPSVILGMLLVCLLSIVIESIAAEKEFRVWNITLVHHGRKLGYLQDVGTNLSYAKELRIYQLGSWLTGKLTDVINKIIKEITKTVRGFVIVAIISNALIILFNGALYLYFFQLASQGKISIAEVSVYFNAVNSFFVALLAASNSVVILYKSGHYLQSYDEYIRIEEVEESSELKQNKAMDPVYGLYGDLSIEFQDVWFRYPGTDADILKGVTFKVSPGSKVAIVGDNGAGKTTVIKLLMKFYMPDSGTISLNGINIWKIPNKLYYQNLSAIFQDFKILNYSLSENIVFNETYDKKDLDKIMADLKQTEMVTRLPAGYETICGRLFGEDGIELSGGQAQKVAIARALFKDSRIIILDEPTSMLSPESEYEIFQNLNDLTIGKTAIFISHRMSSCRFCDDIIVLDQGIVVEEGEHDTLIKNNGLYCEMFTTQAEFYKQMKE